LAERVLIRSFTSPPSPLLEERGDTTGIIGRLLREVIAIALRQSFDVIM